MRKAGLLYRHVAVEKVREADVAGVRSRSGCRGLQIGVQYSPRMRRASAETIAAGSNGDLGCKKIEFEPVDVSKNELRQGAARHEPLT